MTLILSVFTPTSTRANHLTPNDFLEDIGKSVHNAEVRAHEDLDRLHKALALYTAAEVSMHEFDPQLRLECERMAVRERKRREEHGKTKGKGKAAENGNGVQYEISDIGESC